MRTLHLKPTLIALIAVGGLLLCSPPIAADEGVDLRDCRIYAGPGYPGIKARCGILLQPLNPADPSSPNIDLHVAVVPALTLQPEPDAFVPIAGGPGQSTIEFYAAQAGAFEKIRRKRDIVLIDQRGTGDSSPLTCDMDDAATGIDMTDEEIRAATEECLGALPQDPRYFTTSVAVQDLEALREALGYSQFNLYGVSYGSRVAQHFARRYPAATRSVILDGVVPPQLALGPEIALEAQRALQNIFARCAESDACRARFGNLQQRFDSLTARLQEQPVTVELPDPTSGKPDVIEFGTTELAAAVRLLSYHPSTLALIPLLVSEAADGNVAPLAAQFLMNSAKLADALSIGMHNAVMCTEDAPFYKEENLPREALQQTYIGPLMLEGLQTMCDVWPAGVIDDGFKEPLATSLPVLLLSGAEDPITPPAYAERAMVELQNAKHLVGKSQGHGLAPSGCVPNIMADFVSAAAVTDLDTDCMERLFAMPFFLDFSGPAP